jgi:hypothetical protein
MSTTLQQGIPYGDRPMGYLQSSGVYATTEFLQFLERLQVSVTNAPDAAAGLQAQINQNTAAIATINSQFAPLHETDANLQAQINILMAALTVQFSLPSGSAVALTSGTAATVLHEPVPIGVGTLVGIGSVYFTGSGTLSWARASLGSNAAVIDIAAVGQAGTFVGSASPGTLGFDIGILSMMFLWSGSTTDAYLNAEANFTGSISAYGSFVVIQIV